METDVVIYVCESVCCYGSKATLGHIPMVEYGDTRGMAHSRKWRSHTRALFKNTMEMHVCVSVLKLWFYTLTMHLEESLFPVCC